MLHCAAPGRGCDRGRCRQPSPGTKKSSAGLRHWRGERGAFASRARSPARTDLVARILSRSPGRRHPDRDGTRSSPATVQDYAPAPALSPLRRRLLRVCLLSPSQRRGLGSWA
ncbi:hypothetical protein FM106_08540 [Brachybacterium faecium]|nr:hypothetical protein FM106_08540 [Brachybacterium faecium]